jgi:hypothetical protein
VPDPLVSICIRNFNYETFVAQAIASALAQTYPRTEVIAVDDGSSFTGCDRRLRQASEGQISE